MALKKICLRERPQHYPNESLVARQLPGGLYFKQWSAAGNEEAGGDGRLTVVKLPWIPPSQKIFYKKVKKEFVVLKLLLHLHPQSK